MNRKLGKIQNWIILKNQTNFEYTSVKSVRNRRYGKVSSGYVTATCEVGGVDLLVGGCGPNPPV